MLGCWDVGMSRPPGISSQQLNTPTSQRPNIPTSLHPNPGGSRRPHALEQGDEPRIVAQRLERWVHLQPDDRLGAVGVDALEQIEGLVVLAERAVDAGQEERQQIFR